MSRKAPKPEVVRALFALSGNRCAFPGCTQLLISDKGTFIAQLCHIEAANEGGERYNLKQTDEERRSQNNLLLLCYPHHRETDDVKEYTAKKLKAIKKKHEKKFRGQYQLPEPLVDKVMNSIQLELDKLFAISKDTNTVVHGMDEKINELLRRTEPQLGPEDDKIYVEQLESIKELKKQGKYKTAIDLLLDFKRKNWEKLNPETKYKVLANIGICYLDLHDKPGAIEFLLAIKDTQYESGDSLAVLCLGYAIAGLEQDFDLTFQKALTKDRNNINLWVAFIERQRKHMTFDELKKEIPDTVLESVPVLFSLAGIIIDKGNKKEGIALLKRTLELQEESPEKMANTKALIGTRILQNLIDPFKYTYGNYAPEELNELMEAKTLLTEAWEVIGETEQAKYKWYIILNRGVINKVTGQKSQALFDFQNAFDLSHEFLAFKNLLFMYLDLGNFTSAELLLLKPNFVRDLDSEELFEIQTFTARLAFLQGKFEDSISTMSELLDEDNQSKYEQIVAYIIALCFESKHLTEAEPWCNLMIEKFPLIPTGHLFSGYLWTKKSDKVKALSFYDKAATLIQPSTSRNEIYELALGYMELEQFEKAIPHFERLANKNILNSFSSGLIHAYFKFGDLQAALALAENLDLQFPNRTYLVEIISSIHEETKQYDKAISIIESFLPHTRGHIKDVMSLRCAKLFSMKRDWENTRKYAKEVTHFEDLYMHECFLLAGLLARSDEEDSGLMIAYETRTRFFDNSEAHMRFTNICLAVKRDESELFPDIVRNDSAVTIKTENGEEKIFLITDKFSPGENALKPDDKFAQQLIGKGKGESILIDKGFGVGFSILILDILDLYTHALRESMKLFETRFAGQQNVGVFRANPGEPDDQLEQVIRTSSLESIAFERQVYEIYNHRKATLGVLAHLFKRNCVKQWFIILTSSEVSMNCFLRNELPDIEFAVSNNSPVILDLTSLLTIFFISRDNNLLELTDSKYIVSQSTLNEIQEFKDELQQSAKDGLFTVSFQDGQMVGHNTPAETIQRNIDTLQMILEWCGKNTQISTSTKLLEVNRAEREKMSDMLGDCFYDTMLLAQEFKAVVISDDDGFKNLLRNDAKLHSFSTYQLAQYLLTNNKLNKGAFNVFRMELVLSNHISIPIEAEQLWKCFDAGGFKLGKPFTVGVQGLVIMQPQSSAFHLTNFLKKLYLDSGLFTTRQQTVLYIFHEVSRRIDFENYKKILFITIEKEFRFLPAPKEEVFQLLRQF